jgi:predicted membrane protein
MINESDKYTGMREMNFGLSRNVYITGTAGAFLGLLLAMWVTSDVGIVAATVIVFAILSGIFGMFV